MKILFFLFASLALAACNNQDKNTISRKDEPDIIRVEAEDEEMNAAIEKAKQTFPDFLKAFRTGKDDYYSVKYRFDHNGEVEHIWLGDLFEKDSALYGTISNVPELIPTIDVGDTVRVQQERISDWVYSDSGLMRGGYTIRVLRSRLSEEEKKQLDKEMGMRIE